MPKTKTKTLPFYPNESYIKRNWAPEQIPEAQMRAIAQAAAHAVKAGVLSPKLAQALVATALVERRVDFGVNVQAYPRSKQMDELFKKMGMTVYAMPAPPPESKDWADMEWDQWEASHPTSANQVRFYASHDESMDMKKTDNWPGAYSTGWSYDDTDEANLSAGARFAAAVLANKARLYGEQNALERWNGIGKRYETNRDVRSDGSLGVPKKSLVASAPFHASKVQQALQMLQHPANAQIRALYEQLLPQQPTLGQIGAIAAPAQQPGLTLADIPSY